MSKLPAERNPIDWSLIKRTLQPGAQVDVQFHDSQPPLPYEVVMVLDVPIVICRSMQTIELLEFEEGATPLVFIPGIRDFFSLVVAIKGVGEDGKYLALSPESNIQFLRRRRMIRLKTPENIGYRVQFEGKSSIYKGIAVQDISRGGIGLLVYAASPIQEGSQAKIEISLARSSEQISALCAVTHCEPHGGLPRMYRIGLQFTLISPRDKQLVAMYIDQLLKSEDAKQRI